MRDLKPLFEDHFLPQQDILWHANFLASCEQARAASEAEFRSEEFQRWLWEDRGVSGIGPGSSVTVPGAYTDSKVIDALWRVRELSTTETRLLAQQLDSEFKSIIDLVTPTHSARRPSARLVRAFVALRPADLFCLMDWHRTVKVRQYVGSVSLGLGLIGQNVLTTHAAMESLGRPTDLAQSVSQSQFGWYIWETIKASEDEGTRQVASEAPQQATDAPTLALLPAKMQRKGMFYVSNNLDLLLSLVRAAEHGMEREDLVNQIAEEAPTLKHSSRQNVIAQAVSLNLLKVDGSVLSTAPAGRALLEGTAPADILTPTFVRNVFGFGLVMADLNESDALTMGEIALRCRGYYPSWTSDFAPNSLVRWLRDLGLAEVEGVGKGAKVSLTEAGEYWASGLPADLRDPAQLPAPVEREAVVPDLEEVPETAMAATRAADIEALIVRFKTDAELGRFVFSEPQIRLVHAALHAVDGKRFILLAGLSGTGKTSMAKAYAQAYCDQLGLSVAAHYEQVSVWPDWTDPSGLLGYVNPLADPPSFHETPALKLLLAAHKNPGEPYFLCLDEMNLARVEHYFAPVLTAMEGRGGRLALHGGDEAVDQVPASIPWPTNLFVIGTVNMDETTHPFSDKVLDRAFTFEFWNADLELWANLNAAEVPADVRGPVMRVLTKLYAALEPARRHFGYRTCAEVLGFCGVSHGLPISEALDAAILAKVLPKIRGEDSKELRQALLDAAQICNEEQLKSAAKKLEAMSSALAMHGVVRFWS